MNELDFFINQIKDPDENVRRQAAQILCQIGEPEIIPSLLEALGDESWQVRNTVVDGLINMKELLDMKVIVDLFNNDDVNVRNSAMMLVSKMEEIAIPYLLNLLETNEEIDGRIFAANVLGMVKSKSGVKAMTNYLDVEDGNLQYAVIEALGRIGSKEASEPLIELFSKVDIWTQYTIIEALAGLDDYSIVDFLLEQFPEETLQIPIMEAMEKIGDERAIPVLIEALASEDEDVVSQAVLCLYGIDNNIRFFSTISKKHVFNTLIKDSIKDIKDEDVITNIVKVIKGDDVNAKLAALHLLQFTGLTFDIEPIVLCLEHEELFDSVRRIIIRSGNNYIDELLTILDKVDENIKGQLIKCMGFLSDDRITGKFVQFINSEVESIKANAIFGLGMMNSRDIMPKVLDLLGDSSELVQAAAFSAISISMTEELVALIAEAAEKAEKSMRIQCIILLGIIGDLSHLDLIINQLSDKDEDIVVAALISLQYIALHPSVRKNDLIGEQTIEALVEMHYSENQRIAEESILTLSRVPSLLAVEKLMQRFEELDDWYKYLVIKRFNQPGCEVGKSFILSLMQRIDDLPVNVLIALCNTVSRLKLEKAIESVKRMFSSEEFELVSAAINTYVALGGDEDKSYLLRFLEEDNWDVVNSAVKGVYELQIKEGAEELLHLALGKFKDNTVVFRNIITAFGKLGFKSGIEEILKYLSNANVHESIAALMRLAASDPEQLWKYYKVEDIYKQYLIICVAGTTKDEFFAPHLKDEFSSAPYQLKKAILISLFNIDSGQCKEFVESLDLANENRFLGLLIDNLFPPVAS